MTQPDADVHTEVVDAPPSDSGPNTNDTDSLDGDSTSDPGNDPADTVFATDTTRDTVFADSDTTGDTVVATDTSPTDVHEPGYAPPSDPLAGAPAIRLYQNLQDAAEIDGVMFGQQHANWDSQTMLGPEPGRSWRPSSATDAQWRSFHSDIEITTALQGAHGRQKAAVYGFSMQKALNITTTDARRTYVGHMALAYAEGGLITMHFPADNPATGGNHKDPDGNPLCPLSTGWSNSSDPVIRAWKAALDDAAAVFALLDQQWQLLAPGHDPNVAVAFRPFHEMLGDAHWWGAPHFSSNQTCPNIDAAAAYRRLFRKTVTYLREERGLHNLLIVWAPGRPTAFSTDWTDFYPGDDVVDIIAFDIYVDNPAGFTTQLVADLAAVVQFNAAHGKVLAIAEFGHKHGLGELTTDGSVNWYWDHFLTHVIQGGYTTQLAYVMTWTNRDEYWVPLPCFNHSNCPAQTLPGTSQLHAEAQRMRGFMQFVNHRTTLMLGDTASWWRMP